MPKKLESCIPSLKAVAADMPDASARELLEEIGRKIANAEEDRLRNAEQKTADAIAEYEGELKKVAALQRRNALFTVQKVRWVKSFALSDTYDGKALQGVLDYLENTTRIVTGGGRGVDAAIDGWRTRFIGELAKRLDELDLVDDFQKDKHTRDVFLEFYSPGSSKNKKARQIRDILFSLNQEMVDLQNMHGAFIRFLPEHVMRQAYSAELLLKSFGPSDYRRVGVRRQLTDIEVKETKERFSEFMLEHLDKEKTFGSDDPKKLLDNVFTNIMEGRGPGAMMGKARGADINVTFSKMGNRATQASRERLLHFKDGESAFAVNTALSPVPLAQATINKMDLAARNIGLMQQLGPNPEATIREAFKQISKAIEQRGGLKKGRAELNRGIDKALLRLGYLDNSARIPESQSMHAAQASVQQVLGMAKLGGMPLLALPDRAIMASTAAHNGINFFTALGESLKLVRSEGPYARRNMILMGGALKSFIGNVHSRYSTGLEGGFPSRLDGATKGFYKATFINKVDDLGTNAIVSMISRNLGALSDLPMNQLPRDLRISLDQFGWSAAEWDAIRSTAYTIDRKTGEPTDVDDPEYKWVTPDRFKQIPNETLDALIKADKRKPSASNRSRERAKLRNKFDSYMTAQRDSSVLVPGAREERIATIETRAGTKTGVAARLLMMFKSFPITMINKVIMREIRRAGAEKPGDWLHTSKNLLTNWNTLALVGTMSVAGYISLTLDELLAGKEPRKWRMDDGTINWKLWQDAMLRGGAFSLYADMLLTEYDGAYNSFMRRMGGPAYGAGEDLIAFASDPSLKKGNRFVQSNMPFQNLFYTKLAMDRILWNQIDAIADPRFAERLERRLRKENSQEFWFGPTD